MKITFFTANMKGGGAERVMCNLINTISKKKPDYDIDLILSDAQGIFIEKISSKINIIDFNKKRVRDCLFPLINYFRNQKPKYFISSLDYVNTIASLAHKFSRSKSKLFFWEHGILSIHSKKTIIKYSFFNKMLINYLYKKPHFIIVVSKGAKNDIIKNYKINPNKIKVIYNGVYDSSIEKLSLNNKVNYKDYIISVGRLVKEKNFFNLLDAFKLVLDKNKKIKLLILGEGPCQLEIKNRIIKLDISDHVLLLGFYNNPFPLIQKSELLVLSSNREGLPTVLIEALALGTQIVSTNCPYGPNEILENGNYGTLVPVDNSFELAKAIKESLDKKIIFDPHLLKNRAKFFSIDKAFSKFINLIEKNK